MPQTLYDKIWNEHIVHQQDDGTTLLYVDRHLIYEVTKKIWEETIKSVGASSMIDMGKIMGALKSKHSDSLDFSKVSVILRGLLK